MDFDIMAKVLYTRAMVHYYEGDPVIPNFDEISDKERFMWRQVAKTAVRMVCVDLQKNIEKGVL